MTLVVSIAVAGLIIGETLTAQDRHVEVDSQPSIDHIVTPPSQVAPESSRVAVVRPFEFASEGM